MLTVSDLSKTYNLQTLFEKVHFSINPGDRVGLIGPNGSGKTTLLRILSGEERPDHGRVHYPSNLRIGYLPQGFNFKPGISVGEVIEGSTGDMEKLNNDLASAAEALSKDPHNEKVADYYDELLRRIRGIDESRTGAILSRLGLSELEEETPVSILSGGQKTRLALALVLLSDPHILLLDEPTNHLDLSSIECLENALSDCPCALILVSHDAYFLRRLAITNWSLSPQGKGLLFKLEYKSVIP